MPSTRSTVAIAALITGALATEDIFPVTKPDFRYEEFSNLNRVQQKAAIDQLDYTAVTWNALGLADVERKGWDYLTTDQQIGATQIGFTKESWDCFIDHYSSAYWAELVANNKASQYMRLGWSQESWEGEGTHPSTEGKWWDQLSDDEKRAANSLCYFKMNWDNVDMNPNDSYFPYNFPEFRYRPWDELSLSMQNTAIGMMNYTEDLWNNLGTHVAEKNTFLNLDSKTREGAMELGFYTHNFDCFMNHYQAYYWSSFHADLLVAVETLGWTEDAWTNDMQSPPLSESKYWADLTPEEKAAATRMCYFEETWDTNVYPTLKDFDISTAITPDGPLPKDINLNIYETTGYAGRSPGQVAAGQYVFNASYRTVVSSTALGVVALAGAFLFF
eukprot:CAMPEP_0201685498 /NCGR_PEP_ID=MMETSP0578-20130828/235_1 /ASSEMBLY_ACC=CAM_ASM_000663 /TAXON_ID=267565 /ORGANISM="Skeletonema grethea, Strain CCMP 1804" /LENGTH=387 /DNA_ID=CAMNT_0048169401 /DNA_START=67 /DNA_END=1230 /DNA_ORIENTATION=-